jgi:probable F420-dependent oxidoreductase
MMRVGVALPQPEIGTEPSAIRDFAQAVEGMGYQHISSLDHIIQAGTPLGDYRAFYSRQSAFHEVMVLFGFLAAVTERIELVTGVVILPQRQAVLVAKQAAEIDVLSKGRLRLGVGLGWSRIEFTALDKPFETRGARIAEQVAVMRRLWTEEGLTFEGRDHRIEDAGFNPLPIQRPIPVWFGAGMEKPVRRAGRIADGLILRPWIPRERILEHLDIFRSAAREAGRDADSLGTEVSVNMSDSAPEQWAQAAAFWREHGVSHLTLRMTHVQTTGVDRHIDALRRFREVWPSPA